MYAHAWAIVHLCVSVYIYLCANACEIVEKEQAEMSKKITNKRFMHVCFLYYLHNYITKTMPISLLRRPQYQQK